MFTYISGLNDFDFIAQVKTFCGFTSSWNLDYK